ncbi:MAG: hypothetical protein ABIF77_08515 [bacterium]
MKNFKKLTLNSETVRVLTDLEATQVQGGAPISWAVGAIISGCVCPAPTIGCPDTVTECICP